MANNNISFVPRGGGGGEPAGNNTQVQYNNLGEFGASSGFTFNYLNNSLNVDGVFSISGSTFLSASNNISNVQIGSGSIALNGNAVAVGSNSSSSYNGSISLGSNANSGDYGVISIGYSAGNTTGNIAASGISIGSFSNSGQNNIGIQSIGVGVCTKSWGANSTAIGSNSQACGTSSINFGTSSGYGVCTHCNDTISIGSQSNCNNNIGRNSIGIGLCTKSIGNNTIAFGTGSKSIGNSSVSIGCNANTYGYYSISIGTRSGFKNGCNVTIGNNSINIGRRANFATNIGENSIGIGFESKSVATNSIAFGSCSRSSGLNSTAIGKYAKTLGIASIALGLNAYTNACGVFGIEDNADGYAGIAIGVSSQSKSCDTIAIGQYSIAQLKGSIAIGRNTKAYGTYATAIQKNATSNTHGIAFGFDSNTFVRGVSIGSFSRNCAINGVTIGYKACSVEDSGGESTSGNISIGDRSKSTNINSISIGKFAGNHSAGCVFNVESGTTSIGYQSNYNNNIGLYSIGIGVNAKSIGNYSIAVGMSNFSIGTGSTVIGGFNNTLLSNNSVLLGGDNQNISGSTYDNHTLLENLGILNTPTNGNSLDDVLVRDSSSGVIKVVSQSGLTGGGSSLIFNNGLTDNNGTVSLGGTLTGSTTIGLNNSSVEFRGQGLQANNFTNMCNSFAFGGNNTSGDAYIVGQGFVDYQVNGNFIVGCGSEINSNRTINLGNYHYIESGATGSIGIGDGVFIGNNTSYSVAIGRYANVYGGGRSNISIGGVVRGTSCYSVAIGYGARACKNCSVAIGEGADACADNTISIGTGRNTFSRALGAISMGCRVDASGAHSIVIGRGYGVCSTITYAACSSIFGGIANSISAGNTNATIVGGDQVNLNGTSYIDHTVVGKLAIFHDPSVGTSTDTVLVRNPTTGIIKQVSQASLGGATTTDPAGSNTHIQYNDNGVFGASANLTFNSGTNTLNIFGQVTLNPPTVGSTSDQILVRNATDRKIKRITASDLATDPAGNSTDIQINNGGSFGAISENTYVKNTVGSTSLTIDWSRTKTFGTPVSPLNSPLSESNTNAIRGTVQKIYHNAASFSMPSNWKLINGEYVPNTLNIMFVEYENSTWKEVTIVQVIP